MNCDSQERATEAINRVTYNFSIHATLRIALAFSGPVRYSEKIVRENRLSLYTLLPTTKRPAVHLLEYALKEMYESYEHEQFINHITWFTSLMDRTKTMVDEEKLFIKEVLHMQYQIDPLLRESPTIRSIFARDLAEAKAETRAEGVAEGIAEGLQEAILDLVSDCFSAQIVSQVQQRLLCLSRIPSN
jgi:predicted transposase YdaD